MSDDLNIRAAKALGCEVHIDKEHSKCHCVKINEMLHKLTGLEIGTWIYFKDIKFTTSYDWAYLGLPSPAKLIFETVVEKVRLRYSKENDFEMRSSPWDFLVATPEELTQAWVEIIEANNGKAGR